VQNEKVYHGEMLGAVGFMGIQASSVDTGWQTHKGAEDAQGIGRGHVAIFMDVAVGEE